MATESMKYEQGREGAIFPHCPTYNMKGSGLSTRHAVLFVMLTRFGGTAAVPTDQLIESR